MKGAGGLQGSGEERRARPFLRSGLQTTGPCGIGGHQSLPHGDIPTCNLRPTPGREVESVVRAAAGSGASVRELEQWPAGLQLSPADCSLISLSLTSPPTSLPNGWLLLNWGEKMSLQGPRSSRLSLGHGSLTPDLQLHLLVPFPERTALLTPQMTCPNYNPRSTPCLRKPSCERILQLSHWNFLEFRIPDSMTDPGQGGTCLGTALHQLRSDCSSTRSPAGHVTLASHSATPNLFPHLLFLGLFSSTSC